MRKVGYKTFMCGIIGYIGQKSASPILIQGLKRLEYRGYDSAGLAVWDGEKINSIKCKGKIAQLTKLINNQNLKGNLGLAHTRWATHGRPCTANAHPLFDCQNKITIVHNGIIENYNTLKKALVAEGHKFNSETDSEVVAHLIEKYMPGRNLAQAVSLALGQVEGTYGLVAMSASQPGTIIAARKGSPLVIGVGRNEYLIASDASAIVAHTKKVIYLNDNELANITEKECQVINIADQNGIRKEIEEIAWDLDKIEKGGFETFMLKEIFEQPQSIANALRGHITADQNQIRLRGLEEIKPQLKNVSRIIIIACGTSWHAGLVGEFLIEELSRIPVEVEYASEFRYRQPVVGQDCLVIVISQSGETADTLAALKLAQEKKALTFGICNVVGSTISRLVDAGCYLHAGPEIGVASTKAFTSQLIVLVLLALYLGRLKNKLSQATIKEKISELMNIPELVKCLLDKSDQILELARRFALVNNFLYLGRGLNYPIALEGALKLKEISYIHAEGYPAAEMKHGPIALIDKKMPVVFIANKDKTYDKIIANILEVRARNGTVIALASQGDKRIAEIAQEVLYIPKTIGPLSPILNTIPLQLLAYHIARLRGKDVDRPRNLAKSVTVE